MFYALKTLSIAILIFAGPWAFADMAQNYSCLKSLSTEFSTTNSGTSLIPLGQPYPGAFFFESFDRPNIIPSNLEFSYDSQGQPIVVANPAKPFEPVSFRDQPIVDRKFVFWEKDRFRTCTEKTRGGEMSFLLDTKNHPEKYRVELTGRTAKFTKTPCDLIGAQSCYLDAQSHCEDMKLNAGNLNTDPINTDILELLKFLLLKKVKALPLEQQKVFTIRRNLKDCDTQYLNTALTIYKHDTGLVIGNTAPSGSGGNTSFEQ